MPYERIEALNRIYANDVEVVITTIEALMQKVIPEKTLYKNILKFKVGQSYDLEQIKQVLINLGYARCDLIEAKGQFSARGGILDVALTDKKGVRIEFWGDDIDSIRYFNISTQRSTEMIKEIEIFPSHEFVLEKSLEEVCNIVEEKYTEDVYKDNIKTDIELIKQGNYISKIDKYFDGFYTNTTNLLDYIKDDYIVFLDEVSKIKARTKNILIDNENIQKAMLDKEKIIPEAILNIYEYEDLLPEILKRKTVYLEKQDIAVVDEETSTAKRNGIRFNTREVNFYKSSMELFIEEV